MNATAHLLHRTAAGLALAAALAAAPAHGGMAEDERRLLDAKAKIMSADYRADLEELGRAREQLTALEHDPRLGYLAYYWSAFAGMRLATNASSRGVDPQEIERNVLAAIDDVDAALRLREDFADGHVLAGTVKGWMIPISLARGETEAAQEWKARANPHLVRARELAPDNPRLAIIEGIVRYNTPAALGGSQSEGLAHWRRAAALGAAEQVTDPVLPDWGEPEGLMSVAWGLLNAAEPDVAGARQAAEAALRLRPDWFYVREVLLPMIDARAAASEP